jgi:membrane-associated phospholipid phosphatase
MTPARRLSALAIALGVAFIMVAIAVDHGVFRPADRWAYHHVRMHQNDWHALALPGTIPVSLILLGIACYRLRDRRRECVLWLGAYAASLMIELAGKLLVARPNAAVGNLLGSSLAQGSFPSGHTMRAVVVAGALAAAWPRYRRLFPLLVVYIAVVVELVGMHTPSEILGGLLAGYAIVAAVHALELPRAVPASERTEPSLKLDPV